MENRQIWLRTPLRTFEAEITQKIRTPSLSEKKDVLIEKKECKSFDIEEPVGCQERIEVRFVW